MGDDIHPKNDDIIYASTYNISITRIIPLIVNVTILQAKANAISDASLESSRRMMGMLMEVTRMTMMMTMNEMKGDGDYANGDDDDDHVGNIN